MIHRETPNFKASLYAPNPKEVTYWIDLKEGPDGLIIKTFNGVEWVMINDALNDKQNEEIENLKDRCTNLEETKVDKTEFNEFVEEAERVHNQLDQDKADKATTLAGYGITDAYTKNETDSRINTAVADLVDQSPETLDTLNELAAALGDDPNFATTVATLIGLKQDTLVSGTNIKTINNESVLGSGNITLVTNGLLTEGLASKVDTSTYTDDKATFALKSEIPDTSDFVSKDGGQMHADANLTFRSASGDKFSMNSGGVKTTGINGTGWGVNLSFSSLIFSDNEDEPGKGARYDAYGVEIYDKTENDLLHAGGGTTKLKTINSQSLLGEGNIDITSGTGGITDAPSDGKLYGRKNAAWTEVTTPDLSSYATKSEIPDVTSKVTGTGITKIEVVETSPSAQEDGVMYLVTSTKEIWIGTVKLYPNA